MASFGNIAFFLVVLITCCFIPAENKLNVQIIDAQCSVNDVQEVGDAQRAINDVTDRLVANTATNSQYNFESFEEVGDDKVWGNGACNGVLSNHDCAACIGTAGDYLIMLCPFKAGAHIKLADCRMRYEPYEFHGPW